MAPLGRRFAPLAFLSQLMANFGVVRTSTRIRLKLSRIECSQVKRETGASCPFSRIGRRRQVRDFGKRESEADKLVSCTQTDRWRKLIQVTFACSLINRRLLHVCWHANRARTSRSALEETQDESS